MKTQMLRESRAKKLDFKQQNYECLGLLLPCYTFLAIPLCIAIGGVFLLTLGGPECFWSLIPLKSLSFAYFGFSGALAASTLGFFQKNINYMKKAKITFLIVGLLIFLHIAVLLLKPFRNAKACLSEKYEGNWIIWLSGPCSFILFLIGYLWNNLLMKAIAAIKHDTETEESLQLLKIGP